MVVPRRLCKRRLHNCPIRPRGCECPHVLEVPRREPLGVREAVAQISREPVDDAGSPAFEPLSGQDLGADGPVCDDQFVVGRRYCALTSNLDMIGNRIEQLGIPNGHSGPGGCHWNSCTGFLVIGHGIHSRPEDRHTRRCLRCSVVLDQTVYRSVARLMEKR